MKMAYDYSLELVLLGCCLDFLHLLCNILNTNLVSHKIFIGIGMFVLPNET